MKETYDLLPIAIVVTKAYVATFSPLHDALQRLLDVLVSVWVHQAAES